MSNEIKAYYCSECRNSYALKKQEVCPQCGKTSLRENPYACLALLKRRRQATILKGDVK
jgi:RNA polymerase subunit RPABC4/transcription elongation factor Spt4